MTSTINKIYFEFLDNLRESGRTDMYGAAPYLQTEFGMTKQVARQTLLEWMESK